MKKIALHWPLIIFHFQKNYDIKTYLASSQSQHEEHDKRQNVSRKNVQHFMMIEGMININQNVQHFMMNGGTINIIQIDNATIG